MQNSRGIDIELGEMIKRGGEAEIRLVKGQPALVAKIYHADGAEREAKLKAMLANPPTQPTTHTALAWPIELLYEGGRLVGFLMPKIDGYDPIISFYNPALRKKRHLGFNWRYLHRTASNLAIVVETVHQAGHLVGDLNESNVLVNDRALVTLVDTDSFQIKGPKTGIYHCLVGKAEYTPAELQGVSLSSVNRQREHDYFGLAVLIFQLLMQGYHPFSGVLPAELSVRRVDVYGIKEGLFPYHQNGTSSRIQTPPNAPSFALLHPDLQALFIRCFVNGHQKPTERPSAREWRAFLQKAEQALVTCVHEATHIYSNHLASCPFCPPEQAMQMPLPAASRIPIQKARPAQIKTQSTAGKKASWAQRSTTYMFILAALFTLTAGMSTIISLTNSFDIGEQEHTSQTNSMASPTPSQTNSIASPTPSQTNSIASPTPAPVLFGTPYPEPVAAIAMSNAYRVRPLTDLVKKEIREVVYSPDGKWLAVTDSTGISLIYSQTLQQMRFIKTDITSSASSMAFAPDNQLLASGSADGTISLWLTDATHIATLKGHSARITSVAFTADSQMMASASWDKTVRLWKSDGTHLATLSGHTSRVKRATFSPDGKILASASDDRTVRLWDIKGTHLATLEGHTSYVNDVAFSPDGRTLATASADKTVRLWSVDGTLRLTERREDDTLEGHTQKVNRIVFSPDGQMLASASADKTIRLWAIDGTGTPLYTLSGQSTWPGSISMAFSPDGKTLASASDERVRLWGVPR